MKKALFIGFLFWYIPQSYGQELSLVPTIDSTRLGLKHSLDSLLKNTPKEVNISVLKQILKEISPKKEKKEHIGWKTKGKSSLLFNQSAFNFDWQGGGTSNIAGNAVFNYEFNYKKKSFSWNNKILGDYGLSFLRNEPFARKTNDRIEFNSRLGQRIKKSNWNYSFFINFLSQFDIGYEFSTDPNTDETIRIEQTHFFSPAFIQAGPGFLWKKNDNLSINIAPVTSRIILVDRKFTTTEGYQDGDFFGVNQGETARYEFGGSLAANLKFLIAKNLTFENILTLYSNYIENPKNVDVDYTTNINLKLNKYISFSFIFQSIYDDNATSAFQVRQVSGIGLDYSF